MSSHSLGLLLRSMAGAARASATRAYFRTHRRSVLTALFSILAAAGAVSYADTERLAYLGASISGWKAHLQDRYTVQLDSAPSVTASLGDAEGFRGTPPPLASVPDCVCLLTPGPVDPATSVSHPLTLDPASAPALALVGVGVRTVSFLRMKVYSAGFYVDDYTLKHLGRIPGWANFTANELQGDKSEALIGALLAAPAACAIRIVPVRNTDFGHLRDGLTRTLLARQKAARARGELSPEDDEKLSVATQQLKGLFPAGSVPKGKQLLLVKSADGKLFAEYEGRVLGTVHNQWVADNMMLAYFANKDVISTALRDDSANGFEYWLQKMTVPKIKANL
ncbi:Altered inheritance of mitochondria protein 18, mitochondrial [Vanrija pseudolonga]|uniref:Altered inheritance of mitochondria protein 18, mitochondrial n=1 Tax=Vanrija pseudolonga TaxID=143232 RepID=A0AAF1BJG8_9TREE|nr:Altered inheritance of mitochondria protein 18, mitochondrial [Vanrija pseudolonga]